MNFFEPLKKIHPSQNKKTNNEKNNAKKLLHIHHIQAFHCIRNDARSFFVAGENSCE